MCGIVGIIAKTNTGFFMPQVKAFKEMLLADMLRGMGGTGIIYSDKLEPKLSKAPCDSYQFLENKGSAKVFEKIFQSSLFAVGHNRAPTKGGVSYKNTHPFREKNISLVHNGTLFSHKSLKDVEVDSHAICHALAEEGVDEVVPKIDGAFALVWYDKDSTTLNLIRNEQRPLHLFESASCYLISSEEGLGRWIAERNNLLITKTTSLEPGTLYSYDLNTFTFSEKVLPLYKWQSKFTPSPYPYTYGLGWEDYEGFPPVNQVTTHPNFTHLATCVCWKCLEEKKAKMDNIGAALLGAPGGKPPVIKKIGDVVEFIPERVYKGNINWCLSGCMYEAAEGGQIETPVKFYHPDEDLVKQLLDGEVLEGEVSQIVYYKNQGGTQYNLTNVSFLNSTAAYKGEVA